MSRKIFRKIKEFVKELSEKGVAWSKAMNAEISKFAVSTKASSGGAGTVVMLFIIAVLAANLLPSAISSLETANTTGWSTGTAAMWALLGLFVVLAVVLHILPEDKLKKLK